LDFQQLYIGGVLSGVTAMLIAVVVYGLLSEYLVAFFAPITYALVSAKFSGLTWQFEESGAPAATPRQARGIG